MAASTHPHPAKRAANLSVNAHLLEQAKSFNINLSATLEAALAQAVKTRQAEIWRAENQQAIAAYNAQVEAEGVFSDGIRGF